MEDDVCSGRNRRARPVSLTPKFLAIMSKRTVLFFVLSFVVISPIGGLVRYRQFLGRSYYGQAELQAWLFVGLMAYAHVVIFNAYRRYLIDRPLPVEAPCDMDPASEVRRARGSMLTKTVDVQLKKRDTLKAVGVQFGCLLFSGLVMDDGSMMAQCHVAIIAHWAIIALIKSRHPTLRTKLDRVLTVWGVIPVMVAVVYLAPSIPRVTRL